MADKGEKVRSYMLSQEFTNYLVLASDNSDDNAFSIAHGDGDMLVSMLTMFFKDNPELLAQVVTTILKIFADVTPQQLLENAARTTGCDCENCRASRGDESAKDSVDINEFIAKGKLH